MRSTPMQLVSTCGDPKMICPRAFMDATLNDRREILVTDETLENLRLIANSLPTVSLSAAVRSFTRP